VGYDGGTKAKVNWKSFLVYNKNEQKTNE